MNRAISLCCVAAATLALQGRAANAAQWSDTAWGVRAGTAFAEPFNVQPDGSRTDIRKAVLSFTQATGQAFGTTFVNVDVLQSDGRDPRRGEPGRGGATEAYAVLRATLDAGKVLATDLAWGPVRGVGLTGGIDLNAKNDGYRSRKQMAVLGPTLMLDVPGFLDVSALWLLESNRPRAIGSRYRYRGHAAVQAAWAIPLGQSGWSLDGYAMRIGAKGRNEFGGATVAETHSDVALMVDLGPTLGVAPRRWRAGIGHEYWRNKFGNAAVSGPLQAGAGATASTPLLRLEWRP